MHAEFWDRVAKTPYARALCIDEKHKQTVTVQLLHTALEHIFLSIEEMNNAQLTDHLEPFINRPLLHKILQDTGVLEEPEVIQSVSRIVAETVLGTDYKGTKVVEHVLYETPSELITGAFEQTFHEFVDAVETLLKAGFRQLNRRFNRYAIVDMVPHLTPQGRIVSLELTFGEDIRHVYYRESFPNGRYSSKVRDADPVCDGEGAPEDN